MLGSLETVSNEALSSGSNRATALSLNACPYLATSFFSYRPSGSDSIEATIVLTQGGSPQLIGSRERPIMDLNALAADGARIVGRLAGVRDGRALFSGSLRNVCALADLKMGRLLAAHLAGHLETRASRHRWMAVPPPAHDPVDESGSQSRHEAAALEYDRCS